MDLNEIGRLSKAEQPSLQKADSDAIRFSTGPQSF